MIDSHKKCMGEGFRWSAMVARGICVLGEMSDEDRLRIEGELHTVAASIQGTRKKKKNRQLTECDRPLLSSVHLILKREKFSLYQKGKGDVAHFLDELEDYLRQGRQGSIMLRLIIRGILRKTEAPRQSSTKQTLGSMRRQTFHDARQLSRSMLAA